MFLLLLCCSCFVAFASAGPPQPPFTIENAEYHFQRFMEIHKKVYTEEERQIRFQIFKNNMKSAARMYFPSVVNIYGYIPFYDLSHQEFFNSYTGFLLIPEIPENVCRIFTDRDIPHVNAPESLDWRDYNLVSPVQNQLACNSCYAFSAVGNIEGQYAKKYELLINLSEQQIIDCDGRNAKGCKHGGHMTYAFRSLIESGGVEAEEEYPYLGVEQFCQWNFFQKKVKLIDCHTYLLQSQEKLKQLLYLNGPLSVAIGVTPEGMLGFQGPHILPEHLCSEKVNHGVLLVGYGTENGEPYWIVKNSWGTEWGNRGYFEMPRGESARSCGMMETYISTAIVA